MIRVATRYVIDDSGRSFAAGAVIAAAGVVASVGGIVSESGDDVVVQVYAGDDWGDTAALAAIAADPGHGPAAILAL